LQLDGSSRKPRPSRSQAFTARPVAASTFLAKAAAASFWVASMPSSLFITTCGYRLVRLNAGALSAGWPIR
jgi:hypothetical protein